MLETGGVYTGAVDTVGLYAGAVDTVGLYAGAVGTVGLCAGALDIGGLYAGAIETGGLNAEAFDTGGGGVDLVGEVETVAGCEATEVAAVDDRASERVECVDHLFSDDDIEGECERSLAESFGLGPSRES